MSVGRNAPCPCGSGLKYKRCCLGREDREWQEWFKADLERGARNLAEMEKGVRNADQQPHPLVHA